MKTKIYAATIQIQICIGKKLSQQHLFNLVCCYSSLPALFSVNAVADI